MRGVGANSGDVKHREAVRVIVIVILVSQGGLSPPHPPNSITGRPFSGWIDRLLRG